jgi:hypothetical protein
MKKLNAILALLRSKEYLLCIPVGANNAKIWNHEFPVKTAYYLSQYLTEEVNTIVDMEDAVNEVQRIISE